MKLHVQAVANRKSTTPQGNRGSTWWRAGRGRASWEILQKRGHNEKRTRKKDPYGPVRAFKAGRRRSMSIMKAFAGMRPLTAEVGVVAAHPVLADGREDIHGHAILQDFGAVRQITPRVCGAF